jgi:DNA-directed RNA polymerase specialized sigma24 family protein
MYQSLASTYPFGLPAAIHPYERRNMEADMFGRQNKIEARERALEYATREDFAAIFSNDMSTLHTLALLLTADQGKAEQCFVAGLEESIQGNPVFREWARAWSKRVIITNAIKMMAPAPGQVNPMPTHRSTQAASERDIWLNLILELPPFERFVFVISVLEGHSVSDCASLLGCTLSDLSRARSQALAHFAHARSSATAAASQPQRTAPLGFLGNLRLA